MQWHINTSTAGRMDLYLARYKYLKSAHYLNNSMRNALEILGGYERTQEVTNALLRQALSLQNATKANFMRDFKSFFLTQTQSPIDLGEVLGGEDALWTSDEFYFISTAFGFGYDKVFLPSRRVIRGMSAEERTFWSEGYEEHARAEVLDRGIISTLHCDAPEEMDAITHERRKRGVLYLP